jgi:hypothetical protein
MREKLTGTLLDRLTHHVHILQMNGDSFRLKHSSLLADYTLSGSDLTRPAPLRREKRPPEEVDLETIVRAIALRLS